MIVHLKEKESVWLRWIEDPDRTEKYVAVTSLASEIREYLDEDREFGTGEKASQPSRQPTRQHGGNQDDGSKNSTFDIELIFVDIDQYYLDDDTISARDQKSKSIKKMMKTSRQRVASHLESIFSTPIRYQRCSALSIDIPFHVVREFNSSVMYSAEPIVMSAVTEVLSKYPKYKKTLKTLATCIDRLKGRQKQESAVSASNSKIKSNSTRLQTTLSLFIYSFRDDKIDLLTL